MQPQWTIVGQGLAGTCLAWEFWKRDIPFTLIDRELGGSSRVAAGLINPVTGKHYEPSWKVATFLPIALDFYHQTESTLGMRYWNPHPIVRLASHAKEWEKMLTKSQVPDVARWISSPPAESADPDWHGQMELSGGGRLDVRAFLDASRSFFTDRGIYQHAEFPADDRSPNVIWCEGARGLMTNRYGPHRCAKGEILTVNAPTWNETTIRIGAGGWLVPIGNHQFKVGSTYEWNELNELPTPSGLLRVSTIARQLGGPDFTVIDHHAGIRPILRRSEPLIGPIENQQWMFNALGSKGSLYAPGVAQQLVHWLIDHQPPDPFLNYTTFIAS